MRRYGPATCAGAAAEQMARRHEKRVAVVVDLEGVMKAKGMSLDISPAVLKATKLPSQEIEQEFRKELALALYQRGVLPLGKARLLARITRWEFEELLGKRRITRHYTEADLKEDIRYGLGRQ